MAHKKTLTHQVICAKQETGVTGVRIHAKKEPQLNKYIAFHDSSNKMINASIRLLYFYDVLYYKRQPESNVSYF